MTLPNRFRLAGYAIALLGLAVNARADITGAAWLVPDNAAGDCARNAVIACIPGTAANATFTLNNTGLNTGFTSVGTNGTINQFILSDTGHVTSGPTFAGGASTTTLLNNPAGTTATNFGACNNASSNCGTIFQFTGSAFFFTGEQFTVNSDDGATLYVGGTGAGNIVLSSPGPQSLHTTTATYNGPTGTFGFTFVYSECCSLPAVFNTNLAAGGNNPVPEPTSIILLGTTMIGVVSLLRRKSRA